jgi:hypothetical protein
VVPTSWLSLAAEIQRSYSNKATLPAFLDVQAQAVGFGMNHYTLASSIAAAQIQRPSAATDLLAAVTERVSADSP